MTTQTEPPQYIAPDTYTGRHMTIRATPTAKSFRAGDIAKLCTEAVIWESFGHPRNRRGEGFARTRFVAAADGALHLYDSTGRKVLVHPADRVIRVLTTR